MYAKDLNFLLTQSSLCFSILKSFQLIEKVLQIAFFTTITLML